MLAHARNSAKLSAVLARSHHQPPHSIPVRAFGPIAEGVNKLIRVNK